MTTRQLDMRFEALKLLLVALIATMLALVLVRQLNGATPQGLDAPRMLPADTTLRANPMGEPPLPQRQWNEDVPMPTVTPEMQGHLWRVLQLHREDHPAEALLLWERVALPPHTQVYKPLAMAVAEMHLKNYDGAKTLLFRARDLAPENGLVAYYMGVLHLEQIAALDVVEPDLGPQFVATNMPWEANDRRAMLELAAIMELRDAIKQADQVLMNEELMPDPQAAHLGPLVGDLVRALRADNFVGKAHHALGDLLLRRGLLREAEEHMDAATETGIPVLFGYEDLGLLYELQGRPADTLRAYQKNFMQRGEPEIGWFVEWLMPGLKR